MSVNFKSPVTSANFNDGFLDKNKDTSTIYKLSLNSPTSGGNLTDAQQAINDNATSVTNHLLDYTAHRNFDTKSNLDTWALTADNGWLCYATDEKKSYQVTDGLLTEIGGGGGIAEWATLTTYAIDDIIWLASDNKIYRCITANSDAVFTPANWTMLGGSTLETNIAISPNNNIQVTDNDGTSILRSESEVLYIEDFKENDHTIFTSVSGTITLSSNTTTPIGKYRSLRADIVSGLANDSFTSPVIAVTDYMKSFGAVGFFSNTKFNGNTGDMQYLVEFNNGTDWTTIPSHRFDIRNGDKLNKFLFQFDSTCVNFRYTPIITSAGDYVLEIGMVRLVSNPMPTAESVESVEYTLLQASGSMTNATNELEFNLGTATITNQINRFIEAVDDSANTRTKFIALRNVKISGSFASSAASNRGLAVTKNGVIYHAGNTTSGAGDYVDVDIEMELSAREYFTVASMDTSRAISATAITGTADLTFTATASSSNVVFEGHATDTEGSPWTPITTGVGTITVYNFTYNRDGKYLIADGYFNAGTTTATKASISLPAGLTIDTSILTRGNTDANPGHIVGEWSEDGTNNSGRMLTATGTSDSVIYFGLQFSTSGALRPQDGNAIINTGNEVAIRFRVPITQWSVADPLISVPQSTIEPTITKVLSASHNTIADITELTFTSLTIGQEYEVDSQFQVDITTTPNVIRFRAGAGDTGEIYGVFDAHIGAGSADKIDSKSFKFIASSETLYLYHSNTTLIYGDGTKSRSFVQLTKRNKDGFVANVARVNHLLGGVEYETGELWAGQKVYARSYEFTGLTVNTVIDNIPSINVISITGTANHPTYGTDYITGLNITDNGSGTGVVWSRYRISTGDFEIVLSGVTVQGTATIKYTR